MNVLFRTRQLQRCAIDETAAIRQWGPDVGRRYTRRIELLHQAPSIRALFASRELDFHPLTGDRAGQHALRLTGRVRLVISVRDAETVLIEEVADYHG